MATPDDSAGKKIVDSVIFTAIARISMALTLPVVTFLFLLMGQVYKADLDRIRTEAKSDLTLLQSQMVSQQQAFDRQMGDVLKRLGELTTLSNTSFSNYHQSQNRINVLETNRAQDSSRLSAMETALTSRYDKLAETMTELNSRMAEIAVEVRGSRNYRTDRDRERQESGQ